MRYLRGLQVEMKMERTMCCRYSYCRSAFRHLHLVSPKDHTLTPTCFSSHLPSQSFGDHIRQARDELLGPLDQLGPDLPVDGSGGTAFERSGYAKPVEDGARAYPILTTVQTGAGNTVGPGQFMKVRAGFDRVSLMS